MTDSMKADSERQLLEQRLNDADARRLSLTNTKQAAVQAQNTKWAEAVLEMRRAIDEVPTLATPCFANNYPTQSMTITNLNLSSLCKNV